MYVRFQAVYSLNQAQHRRLGCMLQKSFVSPHTWLMLSTQPRTSMAAPPPERGEHTEEVLTEFGFTSMEIAELRRAHAV